jgi:FCD domain
MQRSFDGHQLVLNAIKTGEEDKAAAAMREHVAGGLSFLDLIAEFPARDHQSSKENRSRSVGLQFGLLICKKCVGVADERPEDQRQQPVR